MTQKSIVEKERIVKIDKQEERKALQKVSATFQVAEEAN